MKARMVAMIFLVFFLSFCLARPAYAWYDSTYLARYKVYFNNSQQSTNLVNFTVLVQLNSTWFNYNKVQPDGDDVMFVDSDDATRLYFEIENFTNGSTSLFWVRIPQIDTGYNDFIYMYVNKSTAVKSAYNDPWNAWNGSYKAVIHFNSTIAAYDSTPNRNHGDFHNMVSNNYTVNSSCSIGGCVFLNKTALDTSYITFGINASTAPNKGGSVEIFVKADKETWARFAWKNNAKNYNLQYFDTSHSLYSFWCTASSCLDLVIPYNAEYNSLNINYMATTYNGSHIVLVSNGTEIGSKVATGLIDNRTSDILYLGSDTAKQLDGMLDEFRLSDVGYSEDWLRASYLSEMNRFNTYGALEDVPTAVVDCNISSTMAYMFTMKDEMTRADLNGSIVEATFTTWGSDLDYQVNYSFKFQDNVTYTVCINPATVNMTGDIILRYYATGYPIRTYEIYHSSISSQTKYLDLYLLDTGNSTRTKLTVKDVYNNPSSGSIIKIQRYYVDINSYITIAAPKTSSNGDTNAYLQLYDTYYRFVIEKAGTVIGNIAGSLLTSADITLQTSPEVLMEYLRYQGRIASGCTYSAGTQILTCTATDLSGLVNEYCLDVKERGVLTDTILCQSCVDSSTATMLCNVGNATGRAIEYTFYAHLDQNPNILTVLQKMFLQVGAETSKFFGTCSDASQLANCKEGIIVTFFITMTAALVGIYNPAVSLMLMLGTLGMTIYLGLIAITMYSFVGLIFIAGIIIYKMAG